MPRAPTIPTKTKTKARLAWPETAAATELAPKAHGPGSSLQLHREHRRVLRQPRQEVHCPQACSRRAHRQARIPPRPEGSPSEIWRRHGLSARRRRRRSQDYGTIPSLRIKKAGGEVCPAGAGIRRIGELSNLVILELGNSRLPQGWFKLLNCTITKLLSKKAVHGKHNQANQRRTQESQTHRPQETQGGEAAEAPRYARGSKKPKVKKLARGQAKR